MKYLMMAIAMILATTTATFAQVAYNDTTIVEPGLSDYSWKNSVQRWSVWNGSDWAPGLVVRDNGKKTKHPIGTNGLTREIIYDPQAAAAWAQAMTGNGYIRPIGKDNVTKTVRKDGAGNVTSVSKKTNVAW